MDKNNIMIGTWAWGTGANGSSITQPEINLFVYWVYGYTNDVNTNVK